MAGEWPIIPLKNIAEKIASGPFGSNLKGSEYMENGIPVIRGGNLSGPQFNDIDYVYVTDSKANSLSASIAYPSDIVFAARGTIGAVGLVPQGPYQKYLLSSNLAKVTIDLKEADPRFVFYFFRSWYGQQEILAHVNTTGVPKIERALESIRSFRIPKPPLEIQKTISNILGTLDDKIELNRKMNETLEAMARALFKSWFVDFDPVRAKAEGRPTGLPKDIADLFPDSFKDSELGKIPKGWRVGSLDKVAEHPRRGIQPGDIDPSIPYIALEHMPRRCIALTEWGVASGLESNKYEFRQGEILFGKLRPYFHKVGVAPIDGVCSTDIVVVAPCADKWFGFVLGHVSSEVFVEYVNAGSTGTKMPRTSWTEMAHYDIVLPDEPIADTFNKQIAPVVLRMITLIHESRTLATLRDSLLPKLISGDLRIEYMGR